MTSPILRTPDPGPGYGWGDALGDALTGSLGAGLGWGNSAQVEEDVTNGARGIGVKTAQAADSAGLSTLWDSIAAVRRWITDRHNWVRVGYVGSGLALFTIGATLVAKPYVTSAAKDVAGVAGAAKGVAL